MTNHGSVIVKVGRGLSGFGVLEFESVTIFISDDHFCYFGRVSYSPVGVPVYHGIGGSYSRYDPSQIGGVSSIVGEYTFSGLGFTNTLYLIFYM